MSDLRACWDCGELSRGSRCGRHAAAHRNRESYRRKPAPTVRGARSRWGRDLARILDSEGDALAFITAGVDRVGDCWNWPGARTTAGYGSHARRYRITLAHRLVYELAVAPIPDGMVIHHACANRLCVRPDHLRVVTPAENTAEMFERKALVARIEYLEGRLREMGEDCA